MKLLLILGSMLVCMVQWASPQAESAANPTEDVREGLAMCLSERGMVMYGSITCSACRAQRKAFGEAFSHVTEIECNPHAPNTRAELCIEKNIRKTPTWIIEKEGKETKRLEGYQLVEDLAAFAGCAR
ncbi:MAG: thioredoxin family protein [Nitrospira sp.]|nr:thioredoxin family protein [Nitrospira sp.]